MFDAELSMPLQEVPRTQWELFLVGFSRQHDGWLASLDITIAPGEARRVAADLPLSGVTSEQNARQGHSITISLRDRERRVNHTIQAPTKILIDETPGFVRKGIQIQSADGTIAELNFRSPVAPELVDGITPSL